MVEIIEKSATFTCGDIGYTSVVLTAADVFVLGVIAGIAVMICIIAIFGR